MNIEKNEEDKKFNSQRLEHAIVAVLNEQPIQNSFDPSKSFCSKEQILRLKMILAQSAEEYF